MNSETASSPYITQQTGLTAAEKFTALFQPDTLLPEQYFDDRRRQTLLEPEKKLMLAILEDAIDCFQDNHAARCGKRKQLFDEAQEWIFAVGDWVFGFENICSALGFDPQYIRKGLLRWREKHIKASSCAAWQRINLTSWNSQANRRPYMR